MEGKEERISARKDHSLPFSHILPLIRHLFSKITRLSPVFKRNRAKKITGLETTAVLPPLSHNLFLFPMLTLFLLLPPLPLLSSLTLGGHVSGHLI